eukprot:TRINITY_DN12410_c0_g1_i8.p1 TRINITY_DN12410_c0_g1~~TRINITY_DN12410_c0_g1_i8.p1  ORF type:complete len:550 (+),score=141.32 TRINITY_DN12410_c0_g1_i8:202-1851(+)
MMAELNLLCIILLAVVASCSGKNNVLLIMVDDLRPEMSPYGQRYMQTPNLERLANRSTVFERAYVQVALCMPSRTAFLTSRRPDTTKDWTISPNQWFRTCGGNNCAANECGPKCGMNSTTLPQYFLQQGYYTVGMGKIFHEGGDTRQQDYKYSWTPSTTNSDTGIWDKHGNEQNYMPPGTTPSYYEMTCDDDELQDGMLASHAVHTLQNMSQHLDDDGNFFMAVGFHRPHVPWWAPSRFFDMYPYNTTDLAPHKYNPINVPDIALQSVMKGWSECHDGQPSKYTDLCTTVFPYIGNGYPDNNQTVPDFTARAIRQAYRAATSWTDYNIGRVLDALEASPYNDNTVIGFMGDHGYQLGDNNQWAKQTNFEDATRVPFMISLPGDQVSRSSGLVEEVDMMPTLIEAATGTKLPACDADPTVSRNTELCTEGFSLMPLLQGTSNWDHASFSQYTRDANVMGYTIRLDTMRYTEWVQFNYTSNTADFSALVGRELYMYDPPVPIGFATDHHNVAEEPANSATIAKLHDVLVKCHARPDQCADRGLFIVDQPPF